MSWTELIALVFGNAVTLLGVGLAFRIRLEARLVRLETLLNLISNRLGIRLNENDFPTR